MRKYLDFSVNSNTSYICFLSHCITARFYKAAQCYIFDLTTPILCTTLDYMVGGKAELAGGPSTQEYGNIDASFSETPLYGAPSENQLDSNPPFVMSSPDRRQAGVIMMNEGPRTTLPSSEKYRTSQAAGVCHDYPILKNGRGQMMIIELPWGRIYSTWSEC